MIDDSELLRDFVRNHSQPAFTALVAARIDAVYGFALRRVGGDTQLAEDVTLGVFGDLARKSASLQHRSSLSGWLYTSARFAAAKVVRSEQRRKKHEAETQSMNELTSSPAMDWDRLKPIIDHVMDQLSETEREAVLLRYFERRSLADVGRKLASSEDAARKRIDRALDKMRVLLGRHGISSTSAALATALATQPGFAAPSGLAAIAASEALASFGGTSLGAAFAMTTFHKSIIVAALLAVVSTGIFESRVVARQAGEKKAFEKQLADLGLQRQRLLRDRDTLATRLDLVPGPADPGLATAAGQAQTASSMESVMALLTKRAARLKLLLKEAPGKWIPELELLTDDDWLVAAMRGDVVTAEQIQNALLELRNAAKANFGKEVMKAITRYQAINPGPLPADVSLLQSYFESPISHAILDRYSADPADIATWAPPGMPTNMLVVEKRSSLVDEDSDTQAGFSANQNGYRTVSQTGDAFRSAAQRYATANGGAKASSIDQLRPFLQVPIAPARLQQLWDEAQQAPKPPTLTPMKPGATIPGATIPGSAMTTTEAMPTGSGTSATTSVPAK